MADLLMPLHKNENRMLRCHTEFGYVEGTSLFYNIYYIYIYMKISMPLFPTNSAFQPLVHGQ
jgi:hypothetical protein